MWSIVRFDAASGKIIEHVDHWSIEVNLFVYSDTRPPMLAADRHDLEMPVCGFSATDKDKVGKNERTWCLCMCVCVCVCARARACARDRGA